jgi:Holliday junction resolvase-like predicted endonuclease
MPNKDANHDIVVRALKKAGWEIIKEQKSFSIGSDEDLRRLFIDIQAEHVSKKIVLIEVKNMENRPFMI